MSEGIMCEKAKALYVDLVRKTPGTSSKNEEAFKATRGWFEKFKKRTGIYSVVRLGEVLSSDTTIAEKFVPEFQEVITSEGFIPQQVFNCDEAGLFWKKKYLRGPTSRQRRNLCLTTSQ